MVRGLTSEVVKTVGNACNMLALHIQFFTGGEIRAQVSSRPEMPDVRVWVMYVVKDGAMYRRTIGLAFDPYSALLDLAEHLEIAIPQKPEVLNA